VTTAQHRVALFRDETAPAIDAQTPGSKFSDPFFTTKTWAGMCLGLKHCYQRTPSCPGSATASFRQEDRERKVLCVYVWSFPVQRMENNNLRPDMDNLYTIKITAVLYVDDEDNR